MPLEVLLPMVIIGISGVVLLIRLLQPTPLMAFETVEQARSIWNHRNHEADAGQVHVNAAHSHALVETAKGPGVLWSFGADPVTHLLNHPYEIEATAKGIRIKTHEFTAPVIDIPLADAGEKAAWAAILKG